MKDKFSFEYVPNAADARYGFDLGFFGTPAKTMKSLLLILVLPALAIYQLISFSLRGGSTLDYALIALLVAGLWSLIFYFSLRAWLANTMLKRQLANGPSQTIDVDKESIERRTRGRTSKIAWSEISSYRELDRAFVFCKDKRSVAAVEKSAIPSLAELDEFRKFLRDEIGLKPGR